MERSPNSDEAGSFDELLKDAAATPDVTSRRRVKVGATIMNGRFVIERQLGEGGMGIVYQARDTKRGTDVALKMLSHLDATGIYGIKKEFRSLADVVHENLVGLHELFADGDEWFFTMDLVEGVPFTEYVRTDPALGFEATLSSDPLGAPFDATLEAPGGVTGSRGSGALRETRLREVLRQLVAAVSAIHGAGKLHRDLKPSNVLVRRGGRVVILDFGLAKDHADSDATQTIDGGIAGTPGYMAPEQARAERATTASDWYAVGVMLYEALTGSLPFAGRLHEVLLAKQKGLPPAPSDVVASVPSDLSTLCLALLAPEPARRPSGEQIAAVLGAHAQASATRTSADGLATPSASPPEGRRPQTQLSGAPQRAPFVGREKALALLGEALARVGDGRPVVVFVQGLSGMGKTTLVERFLDTALHGDGGLVLRGRCYEREFLPFKAMDAVVDALSRHLRRLSPSEVSSLLPRDIHSLTSVFPVLGRVEAVSAARGRALAADPHERQRRAFLALQELLARIADRARVVVFIDDLQWGDEDSARLLLDVLGPPAPPGLMLIGAYRSDEAAHSTFVQALSRPELKERLPQPVEVSVTPLEASESASLARELLGTGATDETVAAIHLESVGSPYLIAELAWHAGQRTPQGQSPKVENLLLDRVAELPHSAQRLLEVCAVASRPVEIGILAQAAAVESTAAALGALRAAKLIRTSGRSDAVEISHDRVRETIVAGLGAEQTRYWHARLAETLERSESPDAEALARHHAAAENRSAALPHAVRAAERAVEQMAFLRGAELYAFALELGPDEPDERRLRRKLADALAMAGRGAEAGHAYLRAAEVADATAARELRRLAGEQLLISGCIEEGLDILKAEYAALGWVMPDTPHEALAEIWRLNADLKQRGLDFSPRRPEEIPPELLARVDTGWAAALAFESAVGNLAMLATLRNVLDALDAGEPKRVARSLSLFAMQASVSTPGRGKVERALAVAELACGLAGDGSSLAWLTMARGVREYVELGPRHARDSMQQATDAFSEQSPETLVEVGAVRPHQMGVLFFAGRLRAFSDLKERTYEDATRRGDRKLLATSLNLGSFVSCMHNDSHAALRSLDQLSTEWGRHRYDVMECSRRTSRVLVRLYQGSAAAWDDAADHEEHFLPSMLATAAYFRHSVFNAHAHAALARARKIEAWEPLLEVIERDAGEVERTGLAWSAGNSLVIRAGVSARRGRHDEAERQLREALASFESAGVGLYEVPVRWRLGELVGGDEGEALRARADAELRAEGVVSPERWTRMLVPEM